MATWCDINGNTIDIGGLPRGTHDNAKLEDCGLLFMIVRVDGTVVAELAFASVGFAADMILDIEEEEARARAQDTEPAMDEGWPGLCEDGRPGIEAADRLLMAARINHWRARQAEEARHRERERR